MMMSRSDPEMARDRFANKFRQFDSGFAMLPAPM